LSALAARLEPTILVPLRAGRGDGCIFLFPGAGGDADELASLAASIDDPSPLIGVQTAQAWPQRRTVEAMADAALAAIRESQPRGPLRLVGYSFGGLVAMEVARLCQAKGEEVGALVLIDTVFDRRFWPTAIFFAAQLDRVGENLRAMARLSPAAALVQFTARASGLGRRLAERRNRSVVGPEAADGPSAETALDVAMAAMAAYRPSAYSGAVTLLQSAGGRDFGCDPAALWRPLAAKLQVLPMPGRHLDLVRSPASLAILSAALSSLLERRPAVAAGRPRPRALLATSLNWLPTSRLAMALEAAGFDVEAICPHGHSLGRVLPSQRVQAYRALAPHSALRDAIERTNPALVIPCDDRVATYLRDLAAADRGPGADLSALLARSLGAPEAYSRLGSRSGTMDAAAAAGVRHPATAQVEDRRALRAWLDRHGYPAVVKTDGSWGGSGVAVVRSEPDALRAFDLLARPPGLLRTVKRLLVNGEADLVGPCLRRRRPGVSVQAYVAGPLANAAVACFEGRVLAAVYCEVVRCKDSTGPATVVRIVEHPDMAEAVRRTVRHLGLSGLVGFDFVIGAEGASLIEINPRATPTSHLPTADGRDLASALLAAVQGSEPPAPSAGKGSLVALFPQEMMRSGGSLLVENARHDVPWRSAELVAEGLRMVARGRRSWATVSIQARLASER